MQKTFLRRDRNDHPAIAEQNRLAPLLGPVAPGLLLALEGGNGEIGSGQIAANDLGIVRAGTRRRLANHAHRHPSIVVTRVHTPRGEFHETVLQLNSAPLLMTSIPAHWPEPGRARDRTRIPGAVGKIVCKDLAFVGGDEDIIGRRVLSRHRDEPLRLHASGIRAAAAAGILVYSLL